MILHAGDPTGAEPMLVAALAAARRMEMPALEAEISSSLGLCLARLGRSGAARAYLRRAESIFREGNRAGALALHLAGLAEVETLRGDKAAATAALREARTVSQRLPRGLAAAVESACNARDRAHADERRPPYSTTTWAPGDSRSRLRLPSWRAQARPMD